MEGLDVHVTQGMNLILTKEHVLVNCKINLLATIEIDTIVIIISGAGFVFALVNSTSIFLVEGSATSVCIEVVYPTRLSESLDRTRFIRVTMASNSQDREGK